MVLGHERQAMNSVNIPFAFPVVVKAGPQTCGTFPLLMVSDEM